MNWVFTVFNWVFVKSNKLYKVTLFLFSYFLYIINYFNWVFINSFAFYQPLFGKQLGIPEENKLGKNPIKQHICFSDYP